VLSKLYFEMRGQTGVVPVMELVQRLRVSSDSEAGMFEDPMANVVLISL